MNNKSLYKKTFGMQLNKFTIAILLFLFTLLIFNIKFRYVGSGDTKPNELLPISIIYERDFDFNEFVSEQNALPPYFRSIRGRIVSMYSIIPGILNLPVFLIAHICGIDLLKNVSLLSMISSSLIASISVAFMFLCLTKICKKQITAVFFALVYAFATCVWSVACRGIWQHGPSLLFITITLFLLLNENNALIPYAGFFLGMAVFNRPTNIIIALPLTVYIFNNYRGGVRIKYLILAMIPALLFSWYSYVYMGNVLSLGQGHELKLSGHFWRGLPGLLISPGRGLFVFSPIFIFSFAYLIYSLFSKNTRSIYRYLAISVILMVGAYAKWHGWWGGHCFGYRYLIELIPILIIFLALCWEKVITTSRYLKITFFICLVASIYFHFLGAFLYPAGFNYEPNNIDSHTERLWSVKDTELVRATMKLLKYFHVLHE